ncbi:hypothetical protein C8Q70DRAFT_1029934 [Cubamyces menziesii]|nr:hypothetical protein C8Q70DRAFT_1029934 [Cubamyces menziesii]
MAVVNLCSVVPKYESACLKRSLPCPRVVYTGISPVIICLTILTSNKCDRANTHFPYIA